MAWNTPCALARPTTRLGNGLPALREAIRSYSREWLGLDYPVEGTLVMCGARPAIYAAYRTLVDPGDRVLYLGALLELLLLRPAGRRAECADRL